MRYGVKIEDLVQVIAAIYLVYAAVEDIKTRKIRADVLTVFAAISVILLIVTGTGPLHTARLLGVLPGVLLLVISKISKGAVGMGDGLVILWVGYITGITSCLAVLTLTWSLCFVAAAIFYFIKPKEKIPLIPFLCAGYCINIVASYL